MARIKPKSKKHKPESNGTERDMIRNLDTLRQFDNFGQAIAPRLRKMITEGAKPEDILEFAKTMAAARVATIAINSENEAKALSAAQEILNRSEGKPTEKKDVTHRLEKLESKELDALLESLYEKVEDD